MFINFVDNNRMQRARRRQIVKSAAAFFAVVLLLFSPVSSALSSSLAVRTTWHDTAKRFEHSTQDEHGFQKAELQTVRGQTHQHNPSDHVHDQVFVAAMVNAKWLYPRRVWRLPLNFDGSIRHTEPFVRPPKFALA